MKKIVIIGASVAGHTVALNLRKQDKDSSITLLTEESYPAYEKKKLTDFLAGTIKEAELFLASEESYKGNNIDFIKEAKVVLVNASKKYLTFKEKKDNLEYDFLVVASGRRVLLPEIPGAKKNGVSTFYSLSDYKEFLGRIINDAVCIVGSDETALAAARAITSKYKTEVKLISRNNFENLELPPGIEIINNQIQEIIGEGQVQAIKLKDGKVIGVSAVLFREEFKSNIEFLKDTNVEVREDFIVINQNLQTNVEGIFACGAVTGIKEPQTCINESVILIDNLLKQMKGERCQTY